MSLSRVEFLVQKLSLQPHPEGGWFKETYRSDETIKKEHLPERFSGDRHHSTAIYFLLTSSNFSALHIIKSDEMWHHYEGSSLNIYVINNKGELKIHSLGKDFDKGEEPQILVKAGDWFGSRVKDEDSYSLVGCTVAPGFDFNDFQLADREKFINSFPQHKDVIQKLTR